MKYTDRKLCSILSVNSIVTQIRCPLEEERAAKGRHCDGCNLMEMYLKLKSESKELWKAESK